MTTILGAAASGMMHGQTVMDVVGSNIANINSAAYKRIRPLAEGTPVANATPSSGRLGVAESTVDAIFTQGPDLRTDNPLNFAVDDDAFFRATDEGGNPVLTRYGALAVDGAGDVTLPGGRLLDPPVTLPEGAAVPQVDPMGVISALDASGARQPFGQLTMVRFPNPQGLTSLGNALYAESANSGVPTQGTPGDGSFAPIHVGALEGSNVDLAEELTQMLVAQRSYQASAKTFTIGDEMLQLATNITR